MSSFLGIEYDLGCLAVKIVFQALFGDFAAVAPAGGSRRGIFGLGG
jgi:hypothetical protein